jgi:hypothetical protein
MAQPVRFAAVATLAAPARAQQGRPLPGDPVLPGVFRLGPDAATSFEPLNRKVGAAQVVGLGEAIHTSGGFHTLRAYEDEIFYFFEPRGIEARDLAMARRFEHLRRERHPGLRTVIWAHNLLMAPGEYLIAANQLLIPAATFDALFFLERSPAMTPLNRPACGG